MEDKEKEGCCSDDSKACCPSGLQVFCFLGGVAILVVGVFRLMKLGPTEAQMFFGILLVLVVAMLAAVIGLLSDIARSVRK